MGLRLLAALGLVTFLCVVSIHAQERGDRRDRFKPRRTTSAPTTTTTAPTTPGTPARTSGAAQRKSAAVSSAETRRSQGNKARATTRGVPDPIPIVPLPTIPGLSNPNKGENMPLASVSAKFSINGIYYEICVIPGGQVLIPSDFYICCDGKYYENANPNNPKECCGQDFYHPDSEICCQGFYYPKYDEVTLLPTTCCADVYYIPELEICCGSQYDNKFKYGCCNEQFYGLDTHACCNGVEHQKHDNFKCCDTYYGPSDFICCNGYPYHSYFYTCCENKKPYIDSTHKCCPGGDVKSDGDVCIGGQGQTQT